MGGDRSARRRAGLQLDADTVGDIEPGVLAGDLDEAHLTGELILTPDGPKIHLAFDGRAVGEQGIRVGTVNLGMPGDGPPELVDYQGNALAGRSPRFVAGANPPRLLWTDADNGQVLATDWTAQGRQAAVSLQLGQMATNALFSPVGGADMAAGIMGVLVCADDVMQEEDCSRIRFRGFDDRADPASIGLTEAADAPGILTNSRVARDVAAHDGTFAGLWTAELDLGSVVFYREAMLPAVCFE